MKNTLIPLDIIWIDSDREVVHVAENVQPCKVKICPIISSDKLAKYVLEINTGMTKKIGLEVGSRVEIRFSI